MILDIGKGWQIDTAHEDNGERWARLWGPKTLLRPAGKIIERKGFNAIETCLDEFEAIMGGDDDAINEWQQGGECNYNHALLKERGARYCDNCLKDFQPGGE